MSQKKNDQKHDKRAFESLPLDVLIDRAQQARDRKRFREAIDCYKTLQKRKEKRFLPDLIFCYQQLAQEMTSHGRTADAKVVLDHVSNLEMLGKPYATPTLQGSIAPKPSLAQRELNLKTVPLSRLLGSGQFEAAALQSVQMLKFMGSDLSSPELQHEMADAWILFTGELLELEKVKPGIAQDRKNILRALQALSLRQFESGQAALQSIGRNSPFANWKLFLKGWFAFLNGQDSKATTLLEMIETGTTPEQSAKPLLFLLQPSRSLEPKKIRASDPLILEQLAMLIGEAEWVKTLPRADYLWSTKRIRDSYQTCKEQVSSFPCDPAETLGLTGAMTDFYFHSVFLLPKHEGKRFVDFFIKVTTQQEVKNSFEALLAAKMICSFYGPQQSIDHFAETWEIFLEFLEEHFKEQPEVRSYASSLIYAHLAEAFAEGIQEEGLRGGFHPFYSGRKSHKKGLRESAVAKKAIEYIEKAILAQPNQIKYFQLLFSIYNTLEDKSASNRTLERMISIFPENKEILLTAGEACLDRNAYVKSLKYLEKAYALDSTDSRALESILRTYVQAGREAFNAKRCDKGRSYFQSAIALTSRTPQPRLSFIRSLSLIRARWAACELTAGFLDEYEVQRKLIFSSKDPFFSQLEVLFFLELISEANMKAVRFEFQTEFAAQKSFAVILRLLGVLKAVELEKSEGHFEKDAIELLHQTELLLKTRLPSKDEATGLFEILFEVLKGMPSRRLAQSVARELVKRMKTEDPEDARFQLFAYQLEIRDPNFFPTLSVKEKLKKVLELAQSQGDTYAVSGLQKELNQLERLLKSGLPDFDDIFGSLMDDHDDDDDDSEDFDFPEMPSGKKGRWCPNCKTYHPYS